MVEKKLLLMSPKHSLPNMWMSLNFKMRVNHYPLSKNKISTNQMYMSQKLNKAYNKRREQQTLIFINQPKTNLILHKDALIMSESVIINHYDKAIEWCLKQ